MDQKIKLGVGTIRQFDTDGVMSVNSGIALGQDSADPAVIAASPPVAGRLAPDGKGGVFIAAGAKVVDLAKGGGSLTSLTGDPAAIAGTVSSGDGGPAAAARFKGIRSIATDEAHNLYIADEMDAAKGTFRIRFYNRGDGPVSFYAGTSSALVVAPGAIDTIAGAGTAGPAVASESGAPPGRNAAEESARDTTLQGVPPAMAVVKDRLYLGLYWKFPDSRGGNERVRVINLAGPTAIVGGVNLAAGAITTIYNGSGVPAKSAVGYAPGIAADPAGRVFVADELHHRVVRLVVDGSTTTVAGTGRPGFNGNGRPATSALLNHPYDVKLGPRGDLFISDGDNGRARVVLKSGEIRAVFEDLPLWRCAENPNDAKTKAGASKPPSAQPPPGKARKIVERPKLGLPTSPRAGAGHEIYFVNSTANTVMKLTPSGVITALRLPGNVKADVVVPRRGGGLYVSDGAKAGIYLFNTTPRAIDAHGVRVPPGSLKELAQGARPGGGKSQAEGRMLGVVRKGSQVVPAGLAVDAGDNLFVTDYVNGRVLYLPAGGRASVLAGKGAASPLDVCCSSPSGIALDSSGNVYVSDLASGSVWFINRGDRPARAHGQAIAAKNAARIAGTGEKGVGGKGLAVENTLAGPLGLALDRRGDLFIAEAGDSTISKIDPGGLMSTIVGTGDAGFNGDAIKGKLTRLNTPTGVAMDECGNLLIADTGNDRLARFNLGGVCANRAEDGEASVPKQSSDSNKLVLLLVAAAAAGLLIGAAVLVRERRSTK